MTHKEPVRADLQMEKRGRRASYKPHGTVTTGTPEVRAWLQSNTQGHWYFFRDMKTHKLWIAFHKKSDAVMWKLTWH